MGAVRLLTQFFADIKMFPEVHGQQHLCPNSFHEMLYLAGVCRKKTEGWEATVVTEHAAGCVGEIHHRTPLILSGEKRRQWLYDATQARQFLEEAKERVLLKRKKMEGETL